MVPISNHRVSQQLPKETSNLFFTSMNTIRPPSGLATRQSSRAQPDKGAAGTVALNHVGTRVMMSPFCGLSNGWQTWHNHHTHLSWLLISHRGADNVSPWMSSTSFFCFPPTIAQTSWCAIENHNLHIHRKSATEPTANECNVYWQLASRISGQIYDGLLPRAKWRFLSQERCAKHTCCFDGREDSPINCSRTSGSKNKT